MQENQKRFLDDIADHLAIESPEKADIFREGAYRTPPRYSMDFIFNLAVSEGKKARISSLWYVIAILRWTYKTHYLREYDGDIFRFYSMDKDKALNSLKRELVSLNHKSYVKGLEGIGILIEAARNG